MRLTDRANFKRFHELGALIVEPATARTSKTLIWGGMIVYFTMILGCAETKNQHLGRSAVSASDIESYGSDREDVVTLAFQHTGEFTADMLSCVDAV